MLFDLATYRAGHVIGSHIKQPISDDPTKSLAIGPIG